MPSGRFRLTAVVLPTKWDRTYRICTQAQQFHTFNQWEAAYAARLVGQDVEIEWEPWWSGKLRLTNLKPIAVEQSA